MPKPAVREQKERAVGELAEKLGRSQMVVVTDYRGLSVGQMSDLRGRLRQAGAEYQVAKNTLTRFAAEQVGRGGLVEDLQGPTALAFGFEDPTVLAKALSDYVRATRLELPIRGGLLGDRALTAAEIAGSAEFFSFGTNDLTQMTWGFSRDDVEAAFFHAYLDKGIFGVSPFESLDRDGVGRLVQIGVERGRGARAELKLGICGEHGGDPDSVHFFHEVGLDYVSCSPFRVPVARLEAGRAALGAQHVGS